MPNGFGKMPILTVHQNLTSAYHPWNCTKLGRVWHGMAIFAAVIFFHFERPPLFGVVTHSRSQCGDE